MNCEEMFTVTSVDHFSQFSEYRFQAHEAFQIESMFQSSSSGI